MTTETPRGNLHLLEDPEFKDLARRKNRFSLLLTAITLVIYYGFILLVAFRRRLFSTEIAGKIPFGIVLGIGVIIACWILTGIYVRWANQRYDAMVIRIQEKARHGS